MKHAYAHQPERETGFVGPSRKRLAQRLLASSDVGFADPGIPVAGTSWEDDNIPTEITQSQDSQELALLVARAPEYGVRRKAKKHQSRIHQAIKHRKDVQT